MANCYFLTLAAILSLVIRVSAIPTRKEELSFNKGTTRGRSFAKNSAGSPHFLTEGKVKSNPAYHRPSIAKWPHAGDKEGELKSNYTDNVRREGNTFQRSAHRFRFKRVAITKQGTETKGAIRYRRSRKPLQGRLSGYNDHFDSSGECSKSSSSSEEDAASEKQGRRRGKTRGNRGRRSPQNGRSRKGSFAGGGARRRSNKRRKSKRCKKRNRGGSRNPTVVTLPSTAAMVPPIPVTPSTTTLPSTPTTTTQPPTQTAHLATVFAESTTVRFTTAKSTTSLASTPVEIPPTPQKLSTVHGRLGIDPEPK